MAMRNLTQVAFVLPVLFTILCASPSSPLPRFY
jgi:hypothetical protein